MSSKFAPLEIPPGVVAKPTKKMRSSNWSEVNLVRWREGQLSPVGGQQIKDYAFPSRVKAIHGWYDLNGVYYIAYLCEAHLVVESGGVFTDITPAYVGSSVTYSTGLYSVGVYSGVPAYGLAPPIPDGYGGYGDGLYSDNNYGTMRSISTIEQLEKVPDAWSLDNFGAILFAMTSADGRLLMWDPAVGGHAIVTPNAPHGRCFAVTPERFIQVFGATQDGTPDGGSLRRFAWCDQENPTAWNFSDVTSQAGFLDIEPSSPIITACSSKSGTLFWTGKKAYRSRFIGLPYIYNYEELADNCTPWSCASVVQTSSMILWMSEQGAYSYDGTAILPMACMVRPWIDDDIDPQTVRQQACAVHVAPFSEFWWFFPQKRPSNQNGYNTRVAIYSYKEGWWSQGVMSRSAGITASYTAHTIMADGTVAFEHEIDGAETYLHADLPWAETFDLNINSGATLTTVKQLMPDIEGDIASLRYSLFYRNSRSSGTPEAQTALTPVRGDGYVDMRATGRDIRLQVRSGWASGEAVRCRSASDRRRAARGSLMASLTPPAAQPPPDLPYMPDVSTTLSDYLRRFEPLVPQRLRRQDAAPRRLCRA